VCVAFSLTAQWGIISEVLDASWVRRFASRPTEDFFLPRQSFAAKGSQPRVSATAQEKACLCSQLPGIKTTVGMCECTRAINGWVGFRPTEELAVSFSIRCEARRTNSAIDHDGEGVRCAGVRGKENRK